MHPLISADLRISHLGPGTIPSPLGKIHEGFVPDGPQILVSSRLDDLAAEGALRETPGFEAAGPRAKLFHDAAGLTCGIVTCGGLCPGLNDVIRSIVLTLNHRYGVHRVLGFRYGYDGLAEQPKAPPIEMTNDLVRDIHHRGGTLLGSSRGPQDVGEMVDTLVRRGVGLLFAVGGDGTLRGASALCREIERRQLQIGVIGIPKTIDNDIDYMQRSFGFTTAVEAAQASLEAAHIEARGAWNGIGLVQLMGRHSGFIAAHASLANGDVNFCLVPEQEFFLNGEGGLLDLLERRLADRHHAVIVVAEGAGQDLMTASELADASGNRRLQPIGSFLKRQIVEHFEGRGIDMTLKLIDPSYTIRSLRASALDSAFCLMLGQHAVHAGMAGRTDMVVGYWNQHFTHLPIALAVARRKQLDPNGELWHRVLGTTGQPPTMGAGAPAGKTAQRRGG